MTGFTMGLFLLALALAWPPGQSSSVVQAQPPLSASAADSPSQPKPVLPLPESELSAAIERGAGYLCRTQNPDGSWGSPRWTGGVDRDPVPGAFLSFGTATTALCLEALLAVPDSPQIQNARARAEAFLLENLPRLRRADPFNLPNIWGHAYGIQVLAVLARREPAGSARRSRLEQCMREQIKALEHFETVCGGWFYYADGLQRPLAPSASFVNAAVLVALDRAKPLGITMDERIFDSRDPFDCRSEEARFELSLFPFQSARQSGGQIPDQPPGRQPGPVAGVQPGASALGRQADHGRGHHGVARPPDHSQRLARHGQKAADSPRVVRPGRGLFLLLRALSCRPLHRPTARGRPSALPGSARADLGANPGERRLVVRLSSLQLPQALRDCVCPAGLGMLPQARLGP